MKTNRWLKALALAMTVLMMMTVVAIPAVANDAAATDPYADFDKWDGVTVDTTFLAGVPLDNNNGAYTDAVIVDSAAKLAGLAKAVNDAAVTGSFGAYRNVKIYITKNIDLGKYPFETIGKDYSHMFSGLLEGRLDGQEGVAPTIANLYVNTPSSNNLGFVGTLRGGMVKNLTFIDAEVGHKDSDGGHGIAIGYVAKVAEVSGLTVINSKLVTGTGAIHQNGAVVGTFKTDVSINIKDLAAINVEIYCSDGTVNAGGVIGLLQPKSGVVYTIENAYFSGKFTNAGVATHAGILSNMENTTVVMKNCQVNGEILTDKKPVSPYAAFLGTAGAGGSLTLENCLYTGTLSKTSMTAEADCTAMIGTVGGTFALTATNCYAVAGEDLVTIGVNDSDLATVPAFTAVDELAVLGDKAKTALVGFDFENVWATNENALPTLKVAAGDEWATPKHTCVWGEGVETTPATHTTEGVKTFTCECGATKTEVIPKLTAHNWGEGVVTTEPTTEAEGVKTYTCECGETKTESIAKLTADNNDGGDAGDKGEDGGCGSVISATALVAVMTIGLGVTVLRKKH